MSTPPGAATRARTPARDNIFTRRLGPLPIWAWLAIATAIIVAWAWWKNRSSPAASASSGSGTDASQVPQFVNQTYTTVTPPSTPGTTPDGSDLVIPGEPGLYQPPPGTDTGEDKGTGNPVTKVPVNRRHPTHDAGQDTRQEARQDVRQEARQDKRQAPRAPARGGPARIPRPSERKKRVRRG